MSDIKSLIFKSPADIKEMKCSVCTKFLSVPPISHSLSIGYVCGRCPEKTISLKIEKGKTDNRELNLVRQVLYEDVAKYFIFPCTYQALGCSVELKWGEVEIHENLCQFRNTICPLTAKNKLCLPVKEACEWRDNNKQLKMHLTTCHREYFVHPPTLQLLPKFQTKFLFTEILQQVMLILFKYNEETEKYAVYVLADLSDMECNFFRYQVEIFNESRTSSVILRRNRIEPFCDFILKNESDESGLEIDMRIVRETLKNKGGFFVQIGITKKNKKDIKVLKNSLPPESVLNVSSTRSVPLTIDENMLQELECPVCNDYMVPPIFICNSGHSVCEDCNRKVHNCPTCRSPMLKTRNYTLEKLTGLVNYPCKNRSTGCYFVTNSGNIRAHELGCVLTGKKCILNCHWEGNSLEMILHLHDQHTVLKLDTLQNIFLNSVKIMEQKALIFDNQIFLFNYSYGFKAPFQYNMQYLQSDNSKFKYELQIIDVAETGLGIVLRHKCSPVISSYELKKEVKYTLPYDLLKDLVVDSRELNFKINISKI